jgi:hypothetical protein
MAALKGEVTPESLMGVVKRASVLRTSSFDKAACHSRSAVGAPSTAHLRSGHCMSVSMSGMTSSVSGKKTSTTDGLWAGFRK